MRECMVRYRIFSTQRRKRMIYLKTWIIDTLSNLLSISLMKKEVATKWPSFLPTFSIFFLVLILLCLDTIVTKVCSQIENKSASVLIMVRCRKGGKPLSEPLLNWIFCCIYASAGRNEVTITSHVLVTRPQWVTYHVGFLIKWTLCYLVTKCKYMLLISGCRNKHPLKYLVILEK